jgi:hypothetical protein
MNARIARTILLSATFIATSAVANAGAVSPIRIDALTMPRYTLNEFNMLPETIGVSFTNESNMPATDVVIGLVDNQNRTIHQYDESGTFAPGTEIVKQVPYDRVLDHQIGSADVVEVTFADGSVWDKPAPAAPVSRRQATY